MKSREERGPSLARIEQKMLKQDLGKSQKSVSKRRSSSSTLRDDVKSFHDTSRGEFVYRAMCAAIREGRYQQGERIREEDIAASMEVSRTPVREALLRLQTRGLVEFAAGRGLIIAEFDRQQVHELYAMRELLEGASARLAALHATSSEIVYLRYVLEEFRENKGNAKRMAQINRDFHRAVSDAAHNRYMVQSLNELSDAEALLRGTTLAHPGRADSADEEHTAILAAIERRDPDLAEKLAREHIHQAEKIRLRMLSPS